MEKRHKFSIWYVLLGVWVVLIVQGYIASMFAAQTIPYSQFLDFLKAGKIVEVAVTANQIQGKMKAEGNSPAGAEDLQNRPRGPGSLHAP